MHKIVEVVMYLELQIILKKEVCDVPYAHLPLQLYLNWLITEQLIENTCS